MSKTKTDIQKELDALQRKYNDLKARRASLRDERDKITAGIEERNRLIGEALLEGRDASKESDALSRDKAKLDGLDEALAQAESRLKVLEGERDDTSRALARVDFDRMGAEVETMLAKGIDRLKAAVEDMDAISEKFGEMFQIQSAAGMNITQDDHWRLVERIFKYLLDDQSLPLRAKLKNIEESYPAVLARVRSKK